MASVNKLSIRGVRSFSPEDAEQVVEFYFPCTIIVGANGCGKTTIIESLKYAVSGAFPPGNRSGQAFVHDPRSIGQNQVKANVKLRFTSRSGQSMVVVRSMELTQKKKSVTFKQLDGVLRMMNQETGERVSLSHKCSELDKQVPGLLGVSKAVLDHVIFCHQEDASWPLMEGAVLKKRFDEIFDSTRYTKALDVFRKTEKEMNAKVKDLRTELAALASFKHAAEGFRKDLAEQTEQIELLDEEKKDISDGLAKTDQELEEAAAIVDEMEEIQGDIDQCKNQLHQHQSIIKARRDLLDEDLTGRYNVRQLKELLRDFDDKMSTQMDEKDRLESEYREVQQRIERLRQEEMQLNGRMGKFAAEKEAHERHVRERQSKMESIQKTFSIDFHESTTQLGASFAGTMTPASQNFLGASQDGTATTALNDTEVAHFFQTLGRKEVELKANLKNKKERLRKQEDELQAVLTDYGGKVRALESECVKLKEKEAEARRELKELSKDVSDHSRLRKSEVEEAEKNATKLDKQLQQVNNDPRRTEIPVEIRQLEDKIDKLKRELDDDKMALTTLRHSADTQNTIDILQEQCAKDLEVLQDSMKEQSYLMQKYNLQLTNALLNADDDADGKQIVAVVMALSDSVKDKFDTADTNLSRAQDALAKAQQIFSEKAALLKTKQQSVASLKGKCDPLFGAIAKVRKVLESIEKKEPGVSFNNEPRLILDYLDEKLKALEDDAPGTVSPDVIKKVFKRLKKLSKVTTDETDGFDLLCPCCTRNMTGNESATFQERLNELCDENSSPLMRSDPRALDEYRRNKSAYKGWRDVVAENIDDLRDFTRMREELTELETESERLQEDLSDHQNKVDDLKHTLTDSQPEVDELRELFDFAKRVSNDANRIADKRIEVQTKKVDMNATHSYAGRDLRTVEREMTTRMEEKDTLISRINKLNKESSALNNSISNLSTQFNRTTKNANDKRTRFAVEQKATVRKGDIHALLETIQPDHTKIMEKQIAPLRQKIRAKEIEKEKLRNLAAEEEESLNTAIHQFSGDKKYLTDLTTQIDAYTGSNKPHDLDQIVSEVVKVADRIKDQRSALATLEPEVESVRNTVNDQERHKKQLKENVEILESEKRINELVEEIGGLDSKLENVEGRDTCIGKHEEANRRREKQLGAKARIEGRWGEIVEQIRSLKRKLMTEEYKDVDERHRVVTIKVETTKIAGEDLKKYYSALDKALQQFHSVKIAEINKIIRELWLMTYKGEDINNIELVSGAEDGSRASKSYNYRVMMSKGSSKLDMRGRCSAGQRVLACTVIRFALAETFGVNCGCIALDEPTVNLDYKNKKGLAIALAQITASRAQQRNFQMILITHDEEFVSMMKTELSTQTGFSMPEKYFQVRREQAPDGKFYSKISAIDWDELV